MWIGMSGRGGGERGQTGGVGWEGERVGIDIGGWGRRVENGDRQGEWRGRRSGVEGESGDRQEEWGGREWG